MDNYITLIKVKITAPLLKNYYIYIKLKKNKGVL